MINRPPPLRCEPFTVVLTARQFRAYCKIVELYTDTGRVILRELADGIGTTLNGAVCNIRALIRKGWIRQHAGPNHIAGSIVPMMRLEFFRDSVSRT